MNFEIKSFWFIFEMKLKLDTGVPSNLFDGKSINNTENTFNFKSMTNDYKTTNCSYF